MKADGFPFKVIEPSYDFENEYLKMCSDYIEKQDQNYCYSTIEEVRKKIASDNRYAYGEIPANRVKSFSYWFIVDNCIIGTSRFRPELNDDLKIEGGNIGYDVSPQFRKLNYGTMILNWTKMKAFDYGLKEILVTCDDDNIGSYKIIEKNKGKLLEIINSPKTNKMIRRYIIVG